MTRIDLTGRRALVTGSITGIGLAISEALAEAGAAVVAHGLDASRVEATAALWRERGFAVAQSCADLSRPQGVAELAHDLEGWGDPDILVLNASIEIAQSLSELTVEALEMQTATNFSAPLLLLQRFLPGMLERGWGRVVALGSVQEARPNAHHLVYAGTKAAQTHAVLNLAGHVRAPGVTFNVIKPGAVLTERNSERLADPEVHRAAVDRIPLGRLGAPQDCVGAAMLLCSEAGGYINGAEISVDGGMRL